jgi:hypothetical protein
LTELLAPPYSWTNNDNNFVDFRDLLFQSTDALLAGGSRTEPYGDLFLSFVMPNLRQQVLEVESFNSRFVRPFTKKQSGIISTLSFPSTLIEYVDYEPSPLYDRLELRVSNVRIQNLDTVAVPFELMEPKDWNRL